MTFDVSKRSVLVEETADRIVVASEQLVNVRRRIGYKRRKLEVADEVGAIKRGPSTSTYILTDLLVAADCVDAGYNERMIGNHSRWMDND